MSRGERSAGWFGLKCWQPAKGAGLQCVGSQPAKGHALRQEGGLHHDGIIRERTARPNPSVVGQRKASARLRGAQASSARPSFNAHKPVSAAPDRNCYTSRVVGVGTGNLTPRRSVLSPAYFRLTHLFLLTAMAT